MPQRTHPGKKSHECRDCRRALPSKLKLITHQEPYTRERPDVCNQCQKACITKRSSIRKPIIEKANPMHAINVGKLFLGSQNSLYIRELIQEGDLSEAESVIKPSWLGHVSVYIREFTQERDHMAAVNAHKLSSKSQLSLIIRKLITQ